MKKWIWLLAFILVSCGDDRTATSADDMLTQKIPSLEIMDMSGEKVVLPSFIGLEKPLLINVWATWCPPCVKELPDLHELSLMGDFHVVTIATDAKMEAVEAYLKKHEFYYLSVFWDKLGEKTQSQLLARQLPMTFVVDTKGVIRNIYAGEHEWATDEMRALLLKDVSL